MLWHCAQDRLVRAPTSDSSSGSSGITSAEVSWSAGTIALERMPRRMPVTGACATLIRAASPGLRPFLPALTS